MSKRLINDSLALNADVRVPFFSLGEELGEKQVRLPADNRVVVNASFADKKEFRSFAQSLSEKYAPTLNEGNAYLLEAFLIHAEKAAESLLLSVERDNADINEQMEVLRTQGRATEDEGEKQRLRARHQDLARRRKSFPTAPIESVLQQVLMDELFIDGLAYSLIGRNNKIVLHENIYELLGKICDKRNLRIKALPVHRRAIEVANEKDIPLSELVLSPHNFPPKLAMFDIEECEDAAAILVIISFLAGNAKDEVYLYPSSFLLDMAKRVLQNGKIHSFYVKDGRQIVQKFPLSGPWNDGRSNYVEMLKKTALRNILKILK